MKIRLWIVFGMLVIVTLLMQELTTRFHELGIFWQLILPILTMVLSAFVLAISMPYEIYKAWLHLKENKATHAVGPFIPGILASMLLIGPMQTELGVYTGIFISIIVSVCGSLIFWFIAIAPAKIDMVLGTIDRNINIGTAVPEQIRIQPSSNDVPRFRSRRPWSMN